MEDASTKQRIITQALRLFSRRGYDAVSVEEIASAVGIRAPSLYKHFKSKQAIFDAIFEQMAARYEAQAESMQLHLSAGGSDGELFAGMQSQELADRVKALVAYSLHDELVAGFRRMMTVEQFRSPEFARLYTERYVTRMLDYHEELFRRLISRGELSGGDARAMAWQYISPVLLLMSLCDREPDREAEAMTEIEAHIRQFQSIYQRGAQK